MTEQDKANLKEELLELEGMLKACYEKGEKIYQSYGVKFTALHPGWTRDKKPGLLVYCGIEAVAEAFDQEIRFNDESRREKNAFLIHRGCEYSQLPDYDVPRYRRAFECKTK